MALDRRLRELEAINESIRALTSTLEMGEVLRLVLYDIARDELVFAASETLRENLLVGLRVPTAWAIVGWAARTGESVVVNDVARDPRFYPAVDRATSFTTKSVLAVPLRRGDRVVGAVEVVNRHGGERFNDADLLRLEQAAEAAGAELDADAVPHDAAALGRLFAAVASAVPSQAASLLLLDPEGRELLFTASRTRQLGVVDGIRLRCDRGIAGWVARHRQPVRVDDVQRDPRYYPAIEQLTHFTPRGMICVPVASRGRLLGVLQVINKLDGSGFDDHDLDIVRTLADQAAIGIDNAALYHQVRLASITDDLTGLGNTRHFNQMLPQLMAREGPLSLLVMDLDNFKRIVDTHGHLIGSRTIAHVGRIIGGLVRPGDVCGAFRGRRVRDHPAPDRHARGARDGRDDPSRDRRVQRAGGHGRRPVAHDGEHWRRNCATPRRRRRRALPGS